MKKHLAKVFILIILFPILSFSQTKYFTREGHVQFSSDGEQELIESNNFKATSVIDFETGEIEFAVLMKAFEFEKALMEEHFNENYVESELYPKSIFKGEIADLTIVNLEKDGEYEIEVDGALTLHGVTKQIQVPAKITVLAGAITGTASFSVKVSDYKIKIPKVVIKNIAEEITISIICKYRVLNE